MFEKINKYLDSDLPDTDEELLEEIEVLNKLRELITNKLATLKK